MDGSDQDIAAPETAGTSAPTSRAEAIGHAGPYALIEPLGEGAFGSVYLAEQERPIKRRVALKVMKPGVEARLVIARFEAERVALSTLNHPGVGKVFDSGTTREGRPYFAMELVEGEPITIACEKASLDLRERLELMARVCDAVQHGHSKGLIHRDLKPSNVLVEVHDGRLEAKVVDFGVAKALNQRMSDHTLYTERGQMIGTPEYMAPEQAEMSGLDVDMRADVYSLGVLLYELISGLLPFEPGKLKGMGFAELQRVIRELVPPTPSVRFSTLATATEMSGSAERIAAARGMSVRSLISELGTDLDAMTMACIEKDRDQRYQTVAALGLDIRRYLEGHPLLQVPQGGMDSYKKLLRRNPGRVRFAKLGAIGLVVGAVALGGGAYLAEVRARAAEQESAGSRAVIEFLVEDLLAAASPDRFGPGVTMRAALGAAEDELSRASGPGGDLDGMLVAQAEIHSALYETFRTLGVTDRATQHAMRTLELRNGVLKGDDPASIRALGNFGAALLAEGKPGEAEPLLEQAYGAARRVIGKESFAALKIGGEVASAYRAQGRLDDAERVFNEVLTASSRTLGIDHPMTISTLKSVAEILVTRGKDDEAGPLLEDLLERLTRTIGEDEPVTLRMMGDVAEFRVGHGEADEAETLFRDMHARMRRVLGSEHPQTQDALLGLVGALRAQGKDKDAEPLIAQAIELRISSDGADDRRVLELRIDLAEIMRAQGRLDDALVLGDEAVAACIDAVGANDPMTMHAQMRVAQILIDLDQPIKAYPILRKCLDMRLESLPERDWRIGQSQSMLGETMGLLGRYAEAEKLLLAGVENLGDEDRQKADAIDRIVRFYALWDSVDPNGGHNEAGARWQAEETGALVGVNEPVDDEVGNR